MKKPFVAFVFIFCIAQNLSAQTSASHKLVFHSINAIGLQNGSSGSSFMLQSIAGVSLKHTFAGIGAGLDIYKLRSIPLFVDLRQEFGRKKQNPFLYADLGYNLPWLTDGQKQEIYNSNFKGAIYFDAGIGYSIHFHTDALLFSAGYSYKELKNNTREYSCPIAGPCTQNAQKYTYHMPRVAIKVGWQF